MKYLINFIIVFIIIYLFYFLFIINRKEEVKKFKNNTFVKYLVRIYKLANYINCQNFIFNK